MVWETIKLVILLSMSTKEIDFSKQKYNKFVGVSPEGMVLVPYEVLEMLKDFDVWKEFKYADKDWIVEKSAEIFSTREQV
jgi:hypothetical protein